MAIRRYLITGAYGGSRTFAKDLCDYHANIQNKFAQAMKFSKTAAAADAKCEDCRPVEGPLVLDRIIAEDDAKKQADQPRPVRVLPGQRKLPL
jgi:hypothetical protein